MSKPIVLAEFPSPTIYLAEKPGFKFADLRKMTPDEQKTVGLGQETIWVQSLSELKKIQAEYQRNPFTSTIQAVRIQMAKVAEDITALLEGKKAPPSFALLDMTQHNMGYALAAVKPDSKPGDIIFKEDELINIYCGRLMLTENIQVNSDVTMEFTGNNFCIDAAGCRGVASFMQSGMSDNKHSPESMLLAAQLAGATQADGSPFTKEVILKENEAFTLNFDADVTPAMVNTMRWHVTITHPKYGLIPLIAELATKTIRFGELLLEEYGGRSYHFENGKKYFTPTGELIPSTAYLRTHGFLHFGQHTYWGELTSLTMRTKESHIKLKSETGETFTVTGKELRQQLLIANAMWDVSKPSADDKAPPSAPKLVSKAEIHQALGEDFLKQNGGNLNWKTDDKTQTATLTLSFPENSGWKNLFAKRLTEISHSFTPSPTKSGNLRLVVHNVNVASFTRQASDKNIAVAALTNGLSSMSISSSTSSSTSVTSPKHS